MKKRPLISVIIPIYNVENYLVRCLDSVVGQTYKNIEIILIDDGSTDDSTMIAKEYAKNDCRIKLFVQKNKGISSARNRGLKESAGEYITFIDSDDYVTLDYVEFMFSLLEKHKFKSKMALCSLKTIFENGGEISDGNGEIVTLTGKEAIELMCYNRLVDTAAYAKLAKKDLYKHVKFPTDKLFEDIATTYQLIDQCETVECGFIAKYFYMIRSDSIVTSRFDKKKLDLLEMTDKMAMDVNKKYLSLRDATLRRQVYARFSTLNQMIDVKGYSKERKEILEFLREKRTKILKNKLVPRRDKLAYLFLSLGFPIYKIMWKLYLKVKVRRKV